MDAYQFDDLLTALKMIRLELERTNTLLAEIARRGRPL